MAAWVWLSLSLQLMPPFPFLELGFVPSRTGTSVAQVDFSAPFSLDSHQDRVPFRIILYQVNIFSNTPVLTSKVDNSFSSFRS